LVKALKEIESVDLAQLEKVLTLSSIIKKEEREQESRTRDSMKMLEAQAMQQQNQIGEGSLAQEAPAMQQQIS
jgi:hypothetical protein